MNSAKKSKLKIYLAPINEIKDPNKLKARHHKTEINVEDSKIFDGTISSIHADDERSPCGTDAANRSKNMNFNKTISSSNQSRSYSKQKDVKKTTLNDT